MSPGWIQLARENSWATRRVAHFPLPVAGVVPALQNKVGPREPAAGLHFFD
jgi:hypothetical protein